MRVFEGGQRLRGNEGPEYRKGAAWRSVVRTSLAAQLVEQARGDDAGGQGDDRDAHERGDAQERQQEGEQLGRPDGA